MLVLPGSSNTPVYCVVMPEYIGFQQLVAGLAAHLLVCESGRYTLVPSPRLSAAGGLNFRCDACRVLHSIARQDLTNAARTIALARALRDNPETLDRFVELLNSRVTLRPTHAGILAQLEPPLVVPVRDRRKELTQHLALLRQEKSPIPQWSTCAICGLPRDYHVEQNGRHILGATDYRAASNDRDLRGAPDLPTELSLPYTQMLDELGREVVDTLPLPLHPVYVEALSLWYEGQYGSRGPVSVWDLLDE